MGTMTVSLREREQALDALAASLDRARARQGNALFFVGEAGLGKTSLLDIAAEMAGTDFNVVRGRGERMEAVLPFGVAEQLFASLPSQNDGELLGELPAVEPSVPYLRLLRQIQNSLNRPMAILLDDLQWADPDSLNLVAFLGRRLAGLPVALIAALRPWPPEAEQAVVGLAHQGARIENLRSLSRQGAQALLSEAMADAPAAVLERIWRLSGGNPLLMEVLCQTRSRVGELSEGDAHGLLLSRFAGLDEVSMRFARCAAVAGVSFRPDIVVAVAELDGRDAEQALEALFRSGLILDDRAGQMRFAHPLFEQALYGEMAPPVRRRLHARMFESLVEHGLEREAADHAIRGEMVGDRLAGEVLERSGLIDLAAGAVATAARKLDWAVRVQADRCPPQLLVRSAEALIASGRAGEAAARIETLLEGNLQLDWRDEVKALRALGQANYLTGSPDLGDRHTALAVEITERRDPVAAVRPLLDQATIAWMGTGPVAALPLAARARALAAEAPDDLRLAADALWGHLALESGDQSGLAAVEPVGERLAEGKRDYLLRPSALVWPAAAIYGYAHSVKYAERLDEALHALELAREALVEAGAANGIATVTLFIGNQLVRRGRLDAALREADRAEEFSELTPLTRAFAPLIRAEALAWKGRFEESADQCAQAADYAPAAGLWAVSMWSGLIRGQCQLWQGDAAASDRFLDLERQAAQVGLVEPSSQPWVAYAVEAHLAVGRRRDAGRVTADLARLSAGMASRWPASVAALNRGRLLEFDGELDAAEHACREAIETLGGVDLPLLRAEAHFLLGRLIRRAGRSVDARRPLAEAIQTAESTGASHLADRAASELHLAGGRRRRTSAQRDALTPAERRVAVEVASGLTNAEVARRLHISPNTVRTHLKRTYMKLGIESRKQLAELLTAAGTETGAGDPAAQDRGADPAR